MTPRRLLSMPGIAVALVILAFALPMAQTGAGVVIYWSSLAQPFVFASCGFFAAVLALLRMPRTPWSVFGFTLLCGLAALGPLQLLAFDAATAPDTIAWRSGFWCDALALLLLAALSVRCAASLDAPATQIASTRATTPTVTRAGSLAGRYGTPLLFGAWVLVFWQLGVQAFEVPRVLLPAPSLVVQALVAGAGVLAGDFTQTVLHSVLIGGVAGSALGFVTGVAIDRSPFLQRGLLPLAALASTVPLVGIAPIMVMWFGFDWPSKAAVVVVMTVFPMLVNTLAGLAESGRIERDLMRSYGAGYARTLLALRLPVALPFVFNALKLNSTLAMIGAIVAEFFGSPTAGLGFRISTEAARLNMGLVWAAIVVAALSGSVLYALLGWAERRATFWHPSVRVG